MRNITMIEHKNGKLSGEIWDDGEPWQVPEFDYNGKDAEQALLDRLDIVQIEAQLDKEFEGQL